MIRRAVLLGYYGFGNLGDEAVLSAIIQSLRRHFPDIELTALSGSPEWTRSAHGIRAVSRGDLRGVVREIRRSDVFILGGGSLLQNATSTRSLFYYAGMAVFARLLGKPVLLYAQGIGPVLGPVARTLVRLVLRVARAITVRDDDSLALLRSLGIRRPVEVVADPVWALEPDTASRSSEATRPPTGPAGVRPLVGVSVREPPGRPGRPDIRRGGLDSPDGGEYKLAIARSCDALVREFGARIVFLPFQEGDITASREVMSMMETRAHTSRLYRSPERMQRLMAHLDLLIGMRFHSIVFAALAGVPFIAISYDPKVDSLVRMLGDEPAGTIRELSAEGLMKKIREVWRKREEIRLCMENKRKMLAERARRTPEFLLNTRAQVLDLPVDIVDMEGAAARVKEMLRGNSTRHVVTLNAEMAMLAQKDAELRDIIRNADMVVADGAGVVWAARFLGTRLPGRVAGYDLLHRVCRDCAQEGTRVFLLGGMPGVAEAAAKRLRELYSGLRVAGTHHGYFGPGEESSILEKIRESGASVLFVALGTPGQEKWIARNAKNLPHVRVAMGVGGSFDVLAGRTKRAPDWVGRLGFEWLYRLVHQPRRLVRMLALPKFVLAVLARRFGF